MYNKKAFEILNSSINSAIFIDEKAKDFFSGTPVNEQIPEEILSRNLYSAFKENGKSLAVHKFEISDLDKPEVLDYLFNSRDLILLDWELANFDGQEHSLKLLKRAIKAPNVNFCCIYSSSAKFDTITYFLDAYFSGLTKNDFELIRNEYSYLSDEDILSVFGKGDSELISFFSENEIDVLTFPIQKLRNKPKLFLLRIIYISISVEKYFLPEEPVEYEVLNTGNESLIVNNTFVFTLKKEESSGDDYNELLKRISETVIENDSSFFQLLGLEMQSIFNSNERFIDETLLKSSTEAIFQFRNHLKDDKTFGTIIKKLLIEHATLQLRATELKLLDSEFLENISAKMSTNKPSPEDVFQLNVFYNSVSVKSKVHKDIPNLNFGDVFIGENNDYFLCITALCDCYYPAKINGNFYFVVGTEFDDIETAIELGDTAFLSFLPNGKSVYWGVLDKPKLNKIKSLQLYGSTEDLKLMEKDIKLLQGKITKLEENQESLKSSLYKPFYIKPKVFNVENNKLIDYKIGIWDISNNYPNGESNQDLNYYKVDYVTTLRNDYAQRIANHAFGHPARVGVDFVKLK
jgi:hypothetical protein